MMMTRDDGPDHLRFRQTMRHYYPFLPEFPHRLNAWKRQEERVVLRATAGHRVQFEGLRMSRRSLSMRHYLFLSPEHARQKYGGRIRTGAEEELGWGGWRTLLAHAGVGPGPRLPRPSWRERRRAGERHPFPAKLSMRQPIAGGARER